MQVKKQVRTRHGTMNWLKTGKEVHQGCILSPCFFNFYAENIMRNPGLDESQAGIKITGRNINSLSYADEWHHSNGRKQRDTKESLNEGKIGEWKSWLKTQNSKNWEFGIRSHHFMVNRKEQSRNSDRFYFGGLQNHCRQWLQPWN